MSGGFLPAASFLCCGWLRCACYVLRDFFFLFNFTAIMTSLLFGRVEDSRLARVVLHREGWGWAGYTCADALNSDFYFRVHPFFYIFIYIYIFYSA